MTDTFYAIRESCEHVARNAEFVQVDHARLQCYAQSIAATSEMRAEYDRNYHFSGPPDSVLAYLVILDSVNFGSGFFEHFDELPNGSGYRLIASSLKSRFEEDGPWSAEDLIDFTEDDCLSLLGKTHLKGKAQIREFASMFTSALHGLGSFLIRFHGGDFRRLIQTAERSAGRLVSHLGSHFPFNDRAEYHGFPVTFHKKAQLLAWDLHLAFEGKSYGFFNDIHRLSAFADNVLPHVLRTDGVLRYADSLAKSINRRLPLAPQSNLEIEIRAAAIYAVHCIVDVLRPEFPGVSSALVDSVLWSRGHDFEKYERSSRHQTPTIYY